MAGRCECRICVQGREFMRIIEQLPEADKEWMNQFYDQYCNEGLDANVNEAIIDGSWPTADETIKAIREKKAKERAAILEVANGN